MRETVAWNVPTLTYQPAHTRTAHIQIRQATRPTSLTEKLQSR